MFSIKGKAINIDENTTISPVTGKVEVGSIEFEENYFFKKYTIDCTEDIADLAVKENAYGFQITLKKSQILNVDIKDGVKVNSSEIEF